MIQLPIFHKPSKVCLMPLDMNRSRMLLASRSTTTLHFAPSISIGVRFLHKAAKVYIHMSISTCSKQQRWKAVNGEWRGKTPMEEKQQLRCLIQCWQKDSEPSKFFMFFGFFMHFSSSNNLISSFFFKLLILYSSPKNKARIKN